MTAVVEDALAWLAGRWRLDRVVADLAGGVSGSFTGTAEFRPDGGGLRYHEAGTLEFGGHRGPAERALRYRPAGGSRLRVEFDDGRFFHDLDLSGGGWQVIHPCRDDEYRGEFTVLGPDAFRQLWIVTGPAKRQRLETAFQRLLPLA